MKQEGSQKCCFIRRDKLYSSAFVIVLFRNSHSSTIVTNNSCFIIQFSSVAFWSVYKVKAFHILNRKSYNAVLTVRHLSITGPKFSIIIFFDDSNLSFNYAIFLTYSPYISEITLLISVSITIAFSYDILEQKSIFFISSSIIDFNFLLSSYTSSILSFKGTTL